MQNASYYLSWKFSWNRFQGFECLPGKNSLKSNVLFLPFSQHKHLQILPNSKAGIFSLIWQKQFPSLDFQWNWNELDCFCLRLSTKSSPNYAVSMPKHILHAARLWGYHMRTTGASKKTQEGVFLLSFREMQNVSNMFLWSRVVDSFLI